VTQSVRGLFILAGVLGWGLSTADENVQRDTFRAGQWDGAAYFSAAGEFSHCVVLSSQPKSALLFFIQTEPGNFFIAVSRATWKIPAGAQYTVQVSVDGRRWGRYTAEAVTDKTVRFKVEDAEKVASIRSATNMEVVADRETLSLSLKDSRAAIEALGSCVSKNRRTEQAAGTSASTNAFGSKPSNGDAERFGQFIEALLKRAGFEGFERVAANEVGYKKAMFGWRSTNAEGAVYSGDGFDDNLIVSMRSDMAGKCVGDFVATNPHKRLAQNWSVSTFEFACGRGEQMTGTGVMQVSDEKSKTRFVVVEDAVGEASITRLMNGNARLGDLTASSLFQ
jgi:hypothetical protein